MLPDINALFLLSCFFLILFGFAEFLYHYFKVKGETSRKIVHIGTGILTMLFPVFLTTYWSVVFLCTSFLLLLIVSQKYHFLRSIHDIDRPSLGSLLYPVIVCLCFFAYEFHDQHTIYFYLPILTMAIGDPLAALFGKKWPIAKISIGTTQKSLMGCSIFFVTSFLLSSYFLPHQMANWMVAAIWVASFSTLAEFASSNGWDNFSIPLAVLFALHVFAST
jgi:dolichol kinase